MQAAQGDRNRVQGFLGWVERTGNRLPDPVVLFALCLLFTWVASWALSGQTFTEIDPRTKQPVVIVNQLSGSAMAAFLAGMVKKFVGFHPLGVVLVAMMGVGVAEHTGFVTAALRAAMRLTPKALLTPFLILIGLLSHTAADAGYVLVIPLGAVIFQTAGRHPLLGIAAAFAGVSGGFSANLIPASLDPLLSGITQQAANIIDPTKVVNPLCNWWYTAASCLWVVLLGWVVTEKILAPRMERLPVDGDSAQAPTGELTRREWRALGAALASIAVGVGLLTLWALAPDSALRGKDGSLTTAGAPLMDSIVPLIFLIFLVPGVIYGAVAGTVKTHRDVVAGMSKAMGSMSYYLVMAFAAALFIDAFTQSNLGALLALKGAGALKALALPNQVTIVAIILLVASVNLVIGSASAKWALLAPVIVPMLMSVGLSPELAQAAYRVGDSTTNIITPLMPYFPLIVVFCQRYVKSAGIGTLTSMMLPYSAVFIVGWTLFLLAYWALGIPLGIQATYTYP
jgi:aminobenzoyl-glutamate transport protein